MDSRYDDSNASFEKPATKLCNFAFAPELEWVIANLELMPLRMNIGKKDKMGPRQLDLPQRFKVAGWR